MGESAWLTKHSMGIRTEGVALSIFSTSPEALRHTQALSGSHPSRPQGRTRDPGPWRFLSQPVRWILVARRPPAWPHGRACAAFGNPSGSVRIEFVLALQAPNHFGPTCNHIGLIRGPTQLHMKIFRLTILSSATNILSGTRFSEAGLRPDLLTFLASLSAGLRGCPDWRGATAFQLSHPK